MTNGIQKTVVVLAGPTGPTGTIKGVNILSAFTGPTGVLPQWKQATGASGANGLLEKVYNIGPTGIKGEHKTVVISGFAGSSGGGVGSVTSFDVSTAGTTVTLSNGNLTATANLPASDTGVMGFAADSKSAGKYYFEAKYTQVSGGDSGLGISTTTSTYPALGDNGVVGALVFESGHTFVNGAQVLSLPAAPAGDVVAYAIDFTNHLIWFLNLSNTSAGWNGSLTANPATGVGGLAIPAGAFVPVITMTSGSHDAGTFNFGGSAFAGTVPASFTAGWTTGH